MDGSFMDAVSMEASQMSGRCQKISTPTNECSALIVGLRFSISGFCDFRGPKTHDHRVLWPHGSDGHRQNGRHSGDRDDGLNLTANSRPPAKFGAQEAIYFRARIRTLETSVGFILPGGQLDRFTWDFRIIFGENAVNACKEFFPPIEIELILKSPLRKYVGFSNISSVGKFTFSQRFFEDLALTIRRVLWS
jgi:hypothetical protein